MKFFVQYLAIFQPTTDNLQQINSNFHAVADNLSPLSGCCTLFETLTGPSWESVMINRLATQLSRIGNWYSSVYFQVWTHYTHPLLSYGMEFIMTEYHYKPWGIFRYCVWVLNGWCVNLEVSAFFKYFLLPLILDVVLLSTT